MGDASDPNVVNGGPSAKLSGEMVQKLKNLFEVIDEDGDEQINASDLAKLSSIYKLNVTDDEISKMMAGKEFVGFTEFKDLMSGSISRLPSREEMEISLAKICGNKNLTINKRDLIDSLKEAGFPDAETQFSDVIDKFINSNNEFEGTKFVEDISNASGV